MSGNNDPTVMALCGDREVSTVKEVPTDPAFWVRELLIGGQGEARFDGRQIQQSIIFAAHHEADSCCDQIHDDGPIAIQAIESNEGLAWEKTQRGLVGNDHGECPEQLASVLSIACCSAGEEPLMRMGLQERGTSAHDLPTLAPCVARRTYRRQTPLWWWQIRALRQSTLSCSLSSAIEIEDDPSISLPIPQTSHVCLCSEASERVLQEDTAQCFH